MKVLILAGGAGTRLWPVSRKNKPKQIQNFLNQETLLKSTVKRILKGFSRQDVLMSINKAQKKFIKNDLKNLVLEKNYIVEPVKRDTAAAIGLACVFLARKNNKEVIATVNSDHWIKNINEYLRLIKLAGRTAEKYPDHLVLLGIKPQYPETGYGYIKLNKKIIYGFGKDKIYYADGFKEKPDIKTAVKYLRSGSYLWNPAYFVFRADLMLDLFKRFLPKHYAILMKIKNNPDCIKKEYIKLEKISIDYGIMERAEKMLCLKGNFDWTDIGHFRSLYDVLNKDKSGNVIEADYLGINSGNNYIQGQKGKLIATVGVFGMAIVESGNALLVCRLENAQDVKKIVEKIKSKKMEDYL